MIPGKLKRLAMFALLAATAVAGPAASRAVENEILVQYFSGESKTQLVGESYRGCDGINNAWGVRTLYSDRYVTPCH